MSALSDPLLWVAVAFLVATAAISVLLYNSIYGSRARLKRRLANTLRRVESVQSGTSGDLQNRRRVVAGKLKELDANRKREGRRPSVRQMILQAGLDWDPLRFHLGSAALGLLLGGVILLTGLPPIAALFMTVFGWLGLPRFLLKFLAKRRIGKFNAHFADAIDIIVRGIRSGLPIGETFNIIMREMQGPLGEEFRLIVESQRLGLTLDEALARANDRVPSPELRFFAIMLAIQHSTGGNLAETLAKLSEMLRARKRMRDKVSAMSSEAKASAMIIGSLPPAVALMLAFLSPKYIAILFTDHLGHLVLMAGAAFATIGVLIMRKMINFDI